MIRNSVLHAALALSLLTYAAAQTSGYHPQNGFVPDEKTAIKIAEAVLSPIYGEQQIFNERPFHAKLDPKGVWTVKGTLPSGMDGGVANYSDQSDRRKDHLPDARKMIQVPIEQAKTENK